ncbi:MAG: glycine cleavage system protein H [Chlamydiota bacterium]
MKYTSSHEWASWEEEEVKVGLNNLAKRELENIVYIQLPSLGTALLQGEQAVLVESTKSAIEIYSPLTGVVKEVNLSVAENPALLYEKTLLWLFILTGVERKEYEALLNHNEYLRLIQ